MTRDKGRIADEVLVVAAILGDLKAFDELVKRYRPAVLRMSTSIVGAQLAEDVAQEAFLLAFKQLPSIDEPEKFGSWLMVITRNRALRYRSSENRRNVRRVDYDLFLLEQLPSLQYTPVASDDRKMIEEAFAGIDDRYSMPLRLRYIDAMPLKHIASFLNVPVSTVKWRIYQGKSKLREAIERLDPTNSNE